MTSKQSPLRIFTHGQSPERAVQLVWAHGWGVDHQSLLPVSQGFEAKFSNLMLDFPGFGSAPMPPANWETLDYAQSCIDWLKTLPKGQRIWIGHSFGVRIGLRIAVLEPGLLDGLFLIAGAGLKRRRTWRQNLKLQSKIYTYKALKPLLRTGLAPDWLKNYFGSSDYRQAGHLRPVLVRVIQEDLTTIAQQVQRPVHLVYGKKDTETPPELGQRYAHLIPNAQLTLLDHLDHYTILTDGHAQIRHLLQNFVGQVNSR